METKHLEFEAACVEAEYIAKLHGPDSPQAKEAINEAIALAPECLKQSAAEWQQKRMAKFNEAMQTHMKLVQQYGHQHPLVRGHFMEVMEYAPQDLKDTIRQKAQDMGLMPKASAYTEDGEPLYNMAEVAATLGVSQEEAQEALQEMLDECERQGLDSSEFAVKVAVPIHRMQ